MEWKFMFNLCGNIPAGNIPPPCAFNEKAKAGVMAVMYADGPTPQCRILGGNFESTLIPYVYRPFDEDRVTKGYKIHFMNGEAPNGGGTCKGNHEISNTLMLELAMVCDSRPFPATGVVDELPILPKHYIANATAGKEQDCEYEALIFSTAGCP